MAELRVIVEGTYGNVPLPVTGTFTPSGTQNVAITGQPIQVTPPITTAVTSLSAVSATTTGTVYDLGYLSRDYTFVGTSSATLTAGVVRLFGSIDNSAYIQIGSDISCATDFPSATSKAYTGAVDFRYFRADVTTTITGGTVTFKILGA
jgi:hypothetical protein